MAKFTANGATKVASLDTDRGHRYSLRSDGAILRQFRIDGRLEGATIVARLKAGHPDPEAGFRRVVANKFGAVVVS